jgi:hypothetical protein
MADVPDGPGAPPEAPGEAAAAPQPLSLVSG